MLTPRKSFVYIFSLLICCISFTAKSEDRSEHIEKLLDMSLTDLLNIRVSVASLKQENLLQSPAIVSTFSRKELESLGLRKLTDLLSFFPGFVVNEQIAGISGVQVRGIIDSNNQKILFLLDETPYWFAANGSIPLLGIPISIIDKVEVIRGPGSVIYGTNATAGVIKIVTRKNHESDASIEVAENSTYNLSGHYGDNTLSSGSTEYNVAFQFLDSDGYKASVENALVDSMGTTENGEITRFERTKSAYASMRSEKISAFISAFESEKSGGYFGSIRPFTNYIEKSVIANGSYKTNIYEQQMNLDVDFNNYTSEREINNFFTLFGFSGDASSEFVEDSDNYRWRVNLQMRKTFGNNQTLIYGLESERRSTSTSLLKDDVNGANLALLPPAFTIDPRYNAIPLYHDDDVTEMSAYLQYDHHFEKYRFVTGLRYKENSGSGHKYIPRLALVYNVDENQSIKVLYSVGFNSPTSRQQTQVGAFGSTRSDPLEAEVIRSYDLAYVYSGNKDLFIGNLFYIQARDIIENVGGVFQNSGNFDRTGYELDYQRVLTISDKLYGNLSYLHQGNRKKKNDQSAEYASKYTLSFGYRKSFTSNHSIGGSWQYLGKRINVDAYSLVNVSYNYQRQNHQSFLLVDNLLDEEIRHPDVRTIGTSDVTIQARDGRTFMIGYRYLLN